MTIQVHVNRLDECLGLRTDDGHLKRAALAALDTCSDAPAGEVSITFLPAAEMRALNRAYLGRGAATDVLAFELGDGERLLGDIYICPDVASESAEEHGETLARELARLVVHGVLHVLGHDHPEDDSRYESEMFAIQERILTEL